MKVLITREISAAGVKMLEEHPELELDYRKGPPLSPKDLKNAIKDVHAIIPVIPDNISKEIIEAGKNLKVISTYSVGYDHIDVGVATKNKIFVGNTPGNLTESVAEHSLALMMATGRKIAEADRFCRKGNYKYWDPARMLGPKFAGKTLGIIGFGRIGQHLAKICHFGLEMHILYNDPQTHIEAEGILAAKKVGLDELLEKSDVISLHCNLCPETVHLIDDNQFHKMKPTAILINTSRGPVVDEEALVRALKDNIISGAGIDVFEHEPNIHKELKNLENVVLTPHIGSATREARIEMAIMAAQNVIDVLINNTQPRYLVNKELTNSII